MKDQNTSSTTAILPLWLLLYFSHSVFLILCLLPPPTFFHFVFPSFSLKELANNVVLCLHTTASQIYADYMLFVVHQPATHRRKVGSYYFAIKQIDTLVDTDVSSNCFTIGYQSLSCILLKWSPALLFLALTQDLLLLSCCLCLLVLVQSSASTTVTNARHTDK